MERIEEYGIPETNSGDTILILVVCKVLEVFLWCQDASKAKRLY